jgi:signal transduction histidine kinase
MTRILLLENLEISLHRLRVESRRSGIAFVYDYARTPDEFAHGLVRRPCMVVCTLDGIESMGVTEIASEAAAAGVPLFAIGGDTTEEQALLTQLGNQVTGSCKRARLAWLPVLLERAVCDALAGQERKEELETAATRLEAAAEQMRDVQKLAIIGRLTGSIVHEINNPLESITNINYLLNTDETLPPHLRRYVELADQELKRVTEIAKQTLSFYRESQKPERVQLSSLLEEVLVLYARRISEKRIEVVRQYEAGEPVLLFPGEMRQVYANLVANAVEATPVGGRIVLRIHRARRRPPAGSSVEGMRVVIADSGVGIPAEVRRRIGQPFFTTKGQRGTGLGLWVSRAIVHRCHGEIQLRSSTAPERHGTTFSIFLPLNLGPHKVNLPPKTQMSDEDLAVGGVKLRVNGH